MKVSKYDSLLYLKVFFIIFLLAFVLPFIIAFIIGSLTGDIQRAPNDGYIFVNSSPWKNKSFIEIIIKLLHI